MRGATKQARAAALALAAGLGGCAAGPDALGALADGQALSAATGSVVVTVQYRLGLLGFLGHRAVPDAMNLGIRDLQLALGWVQDNSRPSAATPSGCCSSETVPVPPTPA